MTLNCMLLCKDQKRQYEMNVIVFYNTMKMLLHLVQLWNQLRFGVLLTDLY
jgi:hypothetical protein